LTGNLFGSTTASNAVNALIADGGSHVFTKDLVQIISRSIEADKVLTSALSGASDFPIPAELANSSLAQQLRGVARIAQISNTLNVKRQMFFVNLIGFDTHSDQKNDLAELHTELAGALSYFQNTLNSINMGNKVTTFTASDFGRTFTNNGDGCDHGWGTHTFIMGGAVKGKNFYGTFPPTGIGHEYEVGSGRLLPTTSVDQYAATMAKWFGVTSASDMAMVLPNLNKFSNTDLGFMA
jgi:uncharacterized protein (DUF1501 family)